MEGSVANFRLKLIVYQKSCLFFKELKSSWSSNSRGIYHFPLTLYIYIYIYICIYTYISVCVFYVFSQKILWKMLKDLISTYLKNKAKQKIFQVLTDIAKENTAKFSRKIKSL